MRLLKQLFTLSSIVILTSTSALAQDDENEVGVKAGLNLSNLFSDEINDQNARVGYQAGLFFKVGLTDHFAIQPEVLYTTKGTTAEYDNFLTGDGEFTQKFNYIEVPALAVINLNENINIHAGPYFAYLLSAQVENKSANSDFNFIEELDEDDFNRFDYGLAAGVEFEFDIIGFGIRYDYGMAKVGKNQSFSFDGSEISSNNFKNSRNSALSLYLGLRF